MIDKIGVYGSPSFYGGADTEIGDQIYVWNKMGIEVHVVPVCKYLNKDIKKYIESLAVLHPSKSIHNFKNMPVISFCNGTFLQDLIQIRKVASHILWVNCMTYTFPAEENAHKNNWIDLHLYQTTHGENKISQKLISINPNFKSSQFVPYFNIRKFEFKKYRNPDKFVFGRISRDDQNKYMPMTLDIYNSVSTPKEKEAIILGHTANKQEKIIGKITEPWIKAYPPMGISQQSFYNKCDAIVQTSNCYENWPRVGLEAMSSGSVLVVYDNDGWRQQVLHNDTGFLCKTFRDFVFYTSHLAHHPDIKKKMALRAYERVQKIAGLSASMKSWETVFNRI